MRATRVLEQEPWERDLHRAIGGNLQSAAFRAWVVALAGKGDADTRRQRARRGIADAIDKALPYRFDGRAHKILSLHRARARGFGACADAAAAVIAAAALLGDGANTALCYQARPGEPDYAHVRATWGGIAVDPYARYARREVTGCMLIADAEALAEAQQKRWRPLAGFAR